MKDKYRPKTVDQKLGYLVEECGEVLAAVGKTLRWGLDSYNPELPKKKRETNRDWILRELQDLKLAIELVEKEIGHHRWCKACHAITIFPTADAAAAEKACPACKVNYLSPKAQHSAKK